MRDRWFQELSQGPHEAGLSRALSLLDHQVERSVGNERKQSFEIIHGLRDDLRTSATLAMEAGRRWARGFFPGEQLEKAGGYFDWDLDKDIRAIVKGLEEQPSTEINQAIHEALSRGQHPHAAVSRLAKTYQIHRARDIARTVMMNVYAKGALREMLRHGYTKAIRVEVNDHKVCPTCRGRNGQVYLLDMLVDLPDPLTRDTHPRCRGTFIPVINAEEVKPDKPAARHTRSFSLPNGKLVTDAPIEHAMFLKRFLVKQDLPFHIVFDPKLPVTARLGDEVLRLNPQHLHGQDPREVILEAWAQRLWPRFKDVFEAEYMLLTRMGLVRPSKTVKSAEEYWRSEFVAYKMNQLEQAFEVLWWDKTVKE